MIEAHALTRSYGAHLAIQDLNFSVPKGAIAGFLGPNGAGKTTTLRILAGALAGTSGTAKVGGIDVFEDPMSVKRTTGYLPERPPLYEDMRVEAYLAYAATLKRTPDPAHAAARVLERTGLTEVRGRLIAHLSKGFRQRVGLAQALVHDPQVVLLDEPSSGLDPAQRVQMRTILQQLAATGVTVLLSTHVLAEVESLCDHVVIIHRGRIRADAPMSKLAEAATLQLRVGRPEGLAEALAQQLGAVVEPGASPGAFTVRLGAAKAPDVARVAVHHDLLTLQASGGLEATFLSLTVGA